MDFIAVHDAHLLVVHHHLVYAMPKSKRAKLGEMNY